MLFGDQPDRPAEDTGYSEWDIRQFEQATGATVGGTPGDTPPLRVAVCPAGSLDPVDGLALPGHA